MHPIDNFGLFFLLLFAFYCLVLFLFGSTLNFLSENLLLLIKKKLFELSSQYEHFEEDLDLVVVLYQ